MKATKLILIFLLLIVVSPAMAWTPPSNADFLDFYALYNVTNITTEYLFVNGSQLSSYTAGTGLTLTGTLFFI
jgi:hypothetical protein